MSEDIFQDFERFNWRDLDGQKGTIAVGKDGETQVMAFHRATDGHRFILATKAPSAAKLRQRPDQTEAPQDEPLRCDLCGAETKDPWHYSTRVSRHNHACDACWSESIPNAAALPLPPGFPFAREIREEICATLEESAEAPLDENGNVDTSVIMDSDVIDAHRALAEWIEACGPENNNPARAQYIEKLNAAASRDWIDIPRFLRRRND